MCKRKQKTKTNLKQAITAPVNVHRTLQNDNGRIIRQATVMWSPFRDKILYYPLSYCGQERALPWSPRCQGSNINTNNNSNINTNTNLIISTTDCPGCGVGQTGSFTCEHHCGYLASPDYPMNYPPYSNGWWHIIVQRDSYIELEFTTFLVQSPAPSCKKDYLLVYDTTLEGVSKLIDRYCVANLPPNYIHSSWREMRLEFHSDGEHSDVGFFAKYTHIRYNVPQLIQNDILHEGKIIK